MDDKRKRLYVVAVYLIIALIGIVLLVIGVFAVQGTAQSILLNLGTELLGALIISLLLMFFLLQDWQVSDRVERISSRLKSVEDWNMPGRLNDLGARVDDRMQELSSGLKSIMRPSALSFFQARPGLDTYIQTANRIDLCGVTLTTTLERHRRRLLERLHAGAHIRLLVIDSKSEAILTATRKSGSVSDDFYRRRLTETDEHIDWLYENWRRPEQSSGSSREGSLDVGCLPYVPSFRIDSFGAKDPQDFLTDPDAIVFVEIYPHKKGDDSQPVFGLTHQEDGEWYKYFVSQFEAMWSDAAQWQPLQQRLIIRSATYGTPDRWNDVAELLKERISAKGLEVRVANDILGGDPKPGTRKKLEVVYTYGGEEYSAELDEGEMLTLP